MIIRDARPEDAQDLAQLMNKAGSGMPLARWQQLAGKTEDPWDVGYALVRAQTGEFSYKNCRVVEEGDSAVCAVVNAFLMSDAISEDEVPWPPFADPVQELERRCNGSFYLNFIATFEAHQKKGFARQLIKDAEERAMAIGVSKVTLVVLESKRAVVPFYQQMGYAMIQSRAAKAMGDQFIDDRWILMGKDIAVIEKD